MSESEKKVTVVKETAKEKAAVEEKEETKVIVGDKKTEVIFTSTFPVGSKEYTDELTKFELEHAIVVPVIVTPPEPK